MNPIYAIERLTRMPIGHSGVVNHHVVTRRSETRYTIDSIDPLKGLDLAATVAVVIEND